MGPWSHGLPPEARLPFPVLRPQAELPVFFQEEPVAEDIPRARLHPGQHGGGVTLRPLCYAKCSKWHGADRTVMEERVSSFFSPKYHLKLKPLLAAVFIHLQKHVRKRKRLATDFELFPWSAHSPDLNQMLCVSLSVSSMLSMQKAEERQGMLVLQWTLSPCLPLSFFPLFFFFPFNSRTGYTSSRRGIYIPRV